MNVGLDLPFEKFQRHSTGAEHRIVKLANGEAAAEGGARLVTELDDLQLPDHVGARLSWVDHVALNLTCLDARVDRLLPRPALCVQARIYDEPPSAEQGGVQLSKQSLKIAFVPTPIPPLIALRTGPSLH